MTKDTCGICKQDISLFSITLSCKHKSHKECFKDTKTRKTTRCLICSDIILSAKDKKFAGAKTEKKLTRLMKKYGPSYNASCIYNSTKNKNVKKFMLDCNYGIEHALKKEIENGNVNAVNEIIESDNINFHATFNNKTLLDIAIGLGVEQIIIAIKKKVGMIE